MRKIITLTVLLTLVHSSEAQQSPLEILGAVELRFSTEAGKTYQLQSSSDVAGGEWQNVKSPFSGNGEVVSLFESLSTTKKFYRLSILSSDSDLIRLYNFERTLSDSVTGVNATAHGAPQFIARGASTGIQFDGVDDYLTISPIDKFTEGTVCGWIRWDGFGFYSRLFDFGLESQSFHVFNLERTQKLGFDLQFADETNVDVNFFINQGTWYHVALTVHSTNGAALYVNGEIRGLSPSLTKSFSSLPANSSFFIAKSTFPADGLLSGAVDNFRVYKRALSQEEIRFIYISEK